MKIDEIATECRNMYEGENDIRGWILLNPKTERELFLDGSLKKSDNIDDVIIITTSDPIDMFSATLKTIITEKVEDFLIL